MNVLTDSELNTMLAVRGRREKRSGRRQGAAFATVVVTLVLSGVGYLVDAHRCAELEQRLAATSSPVVPSLTACQQLVETLTDQTHGVVAQLQADIDRAQGRR